MIQNKVYQTFKELISIRRSTVLFEKTRVKDSDLTKLFEAARWAASSRNQQPWRFVVSRREDTGHFNQIIDALNEANIEWAKNAPVLIVGVAETISSYNNTFNNYAWHDTGMALAHIMLQAANLGLSTHAMGGFSPSKIRADLNIPEGFEPVWVLAVGYRSENYQGFPQHLVEREHAKRKRKLLDEIVFKNTWGQ